jgi:prolyl 4-hydroxylase
MMVREFDNFLSPELCDKLINLSLDKLEVAEVLGENQNWRTASSCWLTESHNESISDLRVRISEMINMPVENMETLHIVKYDVGGEYKTHQDYFHKGEDYNENISRGGQRQKTALIYLNEDFTGGVTRFPQIYLSIKPEVGKLVIWDNLLSDGTPDLLSSHCGLPVESGEKWIAVIWIREKEFK